MDEEEVENVGSGHESVSSECDIEGGNCEDNEAATDNKNGEQSDCWSWIKAGDFKMQTH